MSNDEDMGTWGAGILDDDLAKDVYDAYRDARRAGEAAAQVVPSLARRFAPDGSEDDVELVFWLAVARAQLDAAELDQTVAQRVTTLVRDGRGLEPWREAGAAELRQRRAVLTRFVKSLHTPAKPGVRPRVSHQPARAAKDPDADRAPFAVGDCLAIARSDGRFAAAVVTRLNQTKTTRSHILSLLQWDHESAPDAAAFRNPAWKPAGLEGLGAIVKYEIWDAGYRRHRTRYVVVCHVTLGDVPPPAGLFVSTWARFWKDVGSR